MLNNRPSSRFSSVTPLILSCYVAPFLIWYLFAPHHEIQDIMSFVIGISAICICGLILFIFLKKFENDVLNYKHEYQEQSERESLSFPSNPPQQIANNKDDLQSIQPEKESILKEEYEERCKKYSQEFSLLQEKYSVTQEEKNALILQKSALEKELQEQLNEYEKHLQELELKNNEIQAIVSLRDKEIEEAKLALHKASQLTTNKEEQIAALQSEISSLHFELRTLLRLEKRGTPESSLGADYRKGSGTWHSPSLPNPYEMKVPQRTQGLPHPKEAEQKSALQILDKCLYSALTLAETSQLKGKNSRLLDFSTDSLAIEKRRLFEVLQRDASLPVFVFCKKEQKVLFTTGPVKQILGISNERAQKDFFTLFEGKEHEMQQALLTINPFETKKIAVCFAPTADTTCKGTLFLGLCPLPPFAHCILGVIDAEIFVNAPSAKDATI